MNRSKKLSKSVSNNSIRWVLRRVPKYIEENIRDNVHHQIKRYRHKSYYWNIGQLYFSKFNPDDIREYDGPILPYKIIYVDPSRITRRTYRMWRPFSFRKKAHGKVLDGTWDRSPILLKDTLLYQGFQQRFEDNIPWEQTAFVTKADDKFTRLNKCKKWEILYEEIKSSGYKTQRQLMEQDESNELDEIFSKISLDRFYQEIASSPSDQSKEFQQLRRLLDEVLVDIGRNGELLYVDGKHRLIIAKLLGLKQIPVTVAYRHREWMEYRDCLYNNNEKTDWHPDLVEIFTDDTEVAN